MIINTNFNFQAEANGRAQSDTQPHKLVYDQDGVADWYRGDKDSDRRSPTLQEYHRLLWSKHLPGGQTFTLTKIGQNRLKHNSKLGEFILSSDRATTVTFAKAKGLSESVGKLPTDELDAFSRLADTIGGIIIWPAKKTGGLTINQARGFGKTGWLLADRLDLTMECVRRYYLPENSPENSPLSEVFKRYDSFFKLFHDFKGYVNFFLFQDMVIDDYKAVKIAQPFNNFTSPPVPKNIEEYKSYMQQTTNLLKMRNKRIDAWSKKQP
jgi:hypothetical protein